MPNPNSLLYSFRDLNVHPDGQTGGHAWIDSASDPDQDYITLWGRKRFLLPVTYFPTNLVYPLLVE